jgi:hypothetical protein
LIQTCSAPQNDRLIFSFVKDIKVGVEKMTRNLHKMIKKTADSLLLSKHSIQFSALFLLLSGYRKKMMSMSATAYITADDQSGATLAIATIKRRGS